MVDPGVLRFLDLVRRELGAADSRMEIGGKEPNDPCIIWHFVEVGSRIVVVFETPPSEKGPLTRRLDTLAEAFFSTTEHATGPSSTRTPPDVAGRRLDDELTRLAERAGARGAAVFDVASPVVWGASRAADAAADALLEDAIVHMRGTESELRPGHTSRFVMKPEVECLARVFAGLYVLILVFEGPLSEPTAVGAVVHALPLIERLVLALPPVDPPSGGAKVMRLPLPRRG